MKNLRLTFYCLVGRDTPFRHFETMVYTGQRLFLFVYTTIVIQTEWIWIVWQFNRNDITITVWITAWIVINEGYLQKWMWTKNSENEKVFLTNRKTQEYISNYENRFVDCNVGSLCQSASHKLNIIEKIFHSWIWSLNELNIHMLFIPSVPHVSLRVI